jgi:hypothetical protein
MKSKTHKEMIKNPNDFRSKSCSWSKCRKAAVGTAATYGYKTTSDKMKEVKADQPLRKSTDKKFMGMTSYKENK